MNATTTAAAVAAFNANPYPRRCEPTPVTAVPCRLEPFGSTGWTVYTFANAHEAAAFVLRFGAASMPCWRRWEIVEGALCRVR